MNKERVLLGAVAYTPAVVEIWEGIKDYFNENGCPFDFVLFSNYEAQVDALLDGFIDIAWNTNLAFIKCDLALSGKARILAMRDTDLDFTSHIVVKKRQHNKLYRRPQEEARRLRQQRLCPGSDNA